MDGDAFRVERDASNQTATVILSRPNAGNRLLSPEIKLLGETIQELGGDETVKAVLVRGLGEAFCLGRQPDKPASKPSALDIRTNVTEPILALYASVRATPVPVIAVVQGEARGFGCALVGQCDLAIASENARFSMPEMDVNLPPTLAISAVLGKVPPKRLLSLVLLRNQISAREALDLGMLSDVAPAIELDSRVAETVARLVDRSRPALCAVKEYMGLAPYMDPAGAARLGANLLSVILSSAKEG